MIWLLDYPGFGVKYSWKVMENDLGMRVQTLLLVDQYTTCKPCAMSSLTTTWLLLSWESLVWASCSIITFTSPLLNTVLVSLSSRMIFQVSFFPRQWLVATSLHVLVLVDCQELASQENLSLSQPRHERKHVRWRTFSKKLFLWWTLGTLTSIGR